jgi:hypothetical protein
MVKNSGKRIPFDAGKHFWNGIIKASNLTHDGASDSSNVGKRFCWGRKIAMAIKVSAAKFSKALKNPKLIVIKIRSYFPVKSSIIWE